MEISRKRVGGKQDHLQPSLLDRLTDDDPFTQQEPRDRRVMSLRRLREAVIRDLTWLLNTDNLSSTQDLSDNPLVATSVINYGLPPLSGNTVSSIDLRAMERLLRDSIINFEPRILKHTLRVRVGMDEGQMNHNALNFDIEGQLWAQPVPLRFLLKTEVDFESGTVTVRDQGGG